MMSTTLHRSAPRPFAGLPSPKCSVASHLRRVASPATGLGSVSGRSAELLDGRCDAFTAQPRGCPSRRRAQSVVVRGVRGSTGEKWWDKDSSPNMRSITGVQELVEELADNSDKLVILDFYASWCGSCRALYPKLCQLMAANRDTIVLLKVDFEENKAMAKSLGVKVLPYFQFYRGAEGRVDAFAASMSKIQRLKDALETHGVPFCSLTAPPDLEEFPEVHPQALQRSKSKQARDEAMLLNASAALATVTTTPLTQTIPAAIPQLVPQPIPQSVLGDVAPAANGLLTPLAAEEAAVAAGMASDIDEVFANYSYRGSRGDLSLVDTVDANEGVEGDTVPPEAAAALKAAVAANVAARQS